MEPALVLPSGVPTIDTHITASHEATGVGDQKDGSAAVFSWLTELSQHILRGPIFAALGVLLEQGFYHGSNDVARRDGIDSDAMLTPLRGEIPSKLHYTGLRGGKCQYIISDKSHMRVVAYL